MAKSAQNAENLQTLIDELLKQKPSEERIQQLMHLHRIPYSNDPIVQLSSVLATLEDLNLNLKSGKNSRFLHKVKEL